MLGTSKKLQQLSERVAYLERELSVTKTALREAESRITLAESKISILKKAQEVDVKKNSLKPTTFKASQPFYPNEDYGR